MSNNRRNVVWDAAMHARVLAFKKRSGMSTSEIVRRALAEYLKPKKAGG